VYEDDAVDVWTVSPAPMQRRQLRPAGAAGAGFTFGHSFALSPDGKTLALWTGAAFELIDTSAGAVRAKTGRFDLRAGEESLFVTGPMFSPDSKQLLAEVNYTKARGFHRTLARWDAAADQKGTRIEAKNFSFAQWWGNNHLFIIGGAPLGDFLTRGFIHE